MIGQYAGINPAIVTGLIDLASTGAQVGFAVSDAKQQRLAQQAQLEAQVRLEAAKAHALAMTPQKSNTGLLIGLGAAGLLALAVGGALLLRR